MRIATWNVNSLKARQEAVEKWLARAEPDVLLMQETKLADAEAQLVRTEQQIAARSRALPLFKATLETDGIAQEMRARRDHPVHVLLRRMYHEGRPGSGGKS